MLDPQGRAEVLDTMRRLNRERGITVLLITHYMEEAAGCDRVIVLQNGHVTMDGTARDVFSRPEELRAADLDLPQPTDLCERLRKAGIDLPAGILNEEECVQALVQRWEAVACR